jgi:hypothetical protein
MIFGKEFNVVCARTGLAILYDNIIEIIDKNLKPVSVYHLDEETINDFILGDYIIHKASNDTV